MGIAQLKQLLRQHCPNAFKKIKLSDFAGRRIAIDASAWMVSNFSIIHKVNVQMITASSQLLDDEKEFMDLWKTFICFNLKFLYYGVVLVWVFDGPPPPEKEDTRLDRKKSRDKVSSSLEEKRREISESVFVSQKQTEELQKCMNYDYHVMPVVFTRLRNLVKALGLPYFVSSSEGEALCSELYLKKKVAGVFSADTDNLVHGCSVLITGFSKDINLKKITIKKSKYPPLSNEVVSIPELTNGERAYDVSKIQEMKKEYPLRKFVPEDDYDNDDIDFDDNYEEPQQLEEPKKNTRLVPTLEIIHLPTILNTLKLSFPRFIDMCILSKCDYNKKIPGIGVVTAFKMISKFGNLENIDLLKKYDMSCLRYKRCRQLFRHTDNSNTTCVTHTEGHLEFDSKLFEKEAENILEEDHVIQLRHAFKDIKLKSPKFVYLSKELKPKETSELKDNGNKPVLVNS